MEILPAMDLMNGKVVRLYKGKANDIKIYGDPVEIAGWISRFFRKIHIVDLDGAFTGIQKNMGIVKHIISEFNIRVEIGGGFRNYKSVEKAYSIGVDNVIIGTKALDMNFMKLITHDFSGIMVSLDSVKGKYGISGWMKTGKENIIDVFERLKCMVKRFIYTITEKDGTLTGLSDVKIERFWNDEEFIYAGGVSSIDDIHLLKNIGFSGVIVGKAIYEKTLRIEDLKKITDSSSN